MFEDTFRHKGLRKKLVNTIKLKGITDEAVLNAIGRVRRHLFMDSSFVQFSYQDRAFPISSGQTISQPFTVAYQTQLLKIEKLDSVLEVGTGSGYQAAILCEMGAKVFTVERHRRLYEAASKLLPALGYNLNIYFGDGYEGLPLYGPFDKIIVTAGTTKVPEVLKNQLKVGGRLVVPVGAEHHQVMKLIIRESEATYKEESRGSFVFVPLLRGLEE